MKKVDLKEGKEETKFVKKDQDPTEKFIFQTNTKTLVGGLLIVVALVVIIVAVVYSGSAIENGQ